MRENLRVVPWTSVGEWEYAAKCVKEHDNDMNMLREALKWLEVWCIRGNTPPPVETTYSFLEIKRCLAENDEKFGTRCLQLALAAAIVRFVNETVDPEQQGVFAMPVSYLAERMNIPRLLVDIRHSATHNELPGLEVLLLGLDMALDWLNDNYWDPQQEYEVAVREVTRKVLDRFVEEMKEYDPLIKSADTFASRCLGEVQHVEYSPEIQRPFLLAMLESPHSIDKLLPLIGVVMRKNELLINIMVDITLLQGINNRSNAALEYMAGIISRESTVARCAKQCFLHYGMLGRKVLEIIVSGVKVTCSKELWAVLDVLLRPTIESGAVHDVNFLNTGMERLLASKMVTESSESCKDWHIPKDWKPMPFGQTKDFNPIVDFKDLMI